MGSNNFFNSTLVQVSIISSSSAAGVSSIASAIALGALLFFKMYRHFTYRLVLYTLVALIIFSFSNMVFLILVYRGIDSTASNVGNGTVLNEFTLFVEYVYTSSFCSTILLMTCTAFFFYELAVRYKQHDSWISDVNYLLLSLTISQLFTGLFFVICSGNIDYRNFSPMLKCSSDTARAELGITTLLVIMMVTLSAVNGVFILGTMVSLCSRACACKATMVTRHRHQKALKETMPLLIPPIISLVYTCLVIVANQFAELGQMVTNLLGSIQGLVAAMVFAIHLYFLGEVKRKKLRGTKKKMAVTYGTMANQKHTHRPTEYTTEGISETCNTDFPHVSEETVEREFLVQHNVH